MLSTRTHILISLLLALCLAVPAAPAAAQQGGPVYVVEAGDTLSGIAQTFGTTVQALMDLNGLQGAGLQPGQRLQIPGYEEVSGELISEPLAFGETVETLSWQSGVPQRDLVRLNRVLNPDRLYLGQNIILTNDQANSRVVADGSVLQVGPGQTVLEHAVASGENPWLLRLRAGHSERMWLAAGELLPLPGEQGSGFRHLPTPLRSISVEPVAAIQGETLVATTETEMEAQVEGALADRPLNFVRAEDGTWVALQGVNALAEPGLYDLTIRALSSEGGPQYAFKQPFAIRSGDYGFDPVLFVPEETIAEENTAPEERLVQEVLAEVSPVKRWQGPFSFPYDHFTESFPSVFGTRRNYNNTGYNYYHTGLDFYGGTGIEILAPAPGRVVLAEELVVRGNTTIIDHGWGVFTMYMHQSEFAVEAGDEVETGQVIGFVGSTGRVTGAHLHWEVRVGGVPVQPLDWVERAYP